MRHHVYTIWVAVAILACGCDQIPVSTEAPPFEEDVPGSEAVAPPSEAWTLSLRALEREEPYARGLERIAIPHFDGWGTGSVPDSLASRFKVGRVLTGVLEFAGGTYRLELKVAFARLNPYESEEYTMSFEGTYERWGTLWSFDSQTAFGVETKSGFKLKHGLTEWPVDPQWLVFDPMENSEAEPGLLGIFSPLQLPPTKGVGWRAGIRRTVDSVAVDLSPTEAHIWSRYVDVCSSCSTGGGVFEVRLPVITAGPLIYVGDPVREFGTLGFDGTLSVRLPLYANPLSHDVLPWYSFDLVLRRPSSEASP